MCSLENQLLITIYLIGNTAWHDTDYTTRRKLERTNASGFRIVDIGGWNAMNLIKLILTLLGLIFGVMLFFWLFGIITSLLWYGFWIAVIAAVGYGGYKLFKKAETKALESEKYSGIGSSYDINMSWDEYERKYLKK